MLPHGMHLRLAMGSFLAFVACTPSPVTSGAATGKTVPTPQSLAIEPVVSTQQLNMVLDRYIGRVVLLDIWASWCAPCVAEEPHLARLQNELSARGLVVISLSLDQDAATLAEYRAKHPVPMKQLHDSQGQIAQELGALGLPSLVLIDRRGEIRYRAHELRDHAVLRSHVDELLGRP